MTVSIEQAQQSLMELIERSSSGETVVITKDHTPVAELRSVTTEKPKPEFGSCRGLLTIVSNDDEHLGDFAEYLK